MSEQNAPAGVPQQPVPGSGTETVGQAPAPAEAPAKKKGGGWVRIAISLVVIAVIAGVGWFLSRDEPSNAKVGDCLAGTTAQELDANKLKVADCGAADAGFKVVARVDDKLESESEDACVAAGAEFEYYYWSGKQGQKGDVLCLVEVTK